MKSNLKSVLRDTAIIFILTFFSGFAIGAANITDPVQKASAIGMANILFTTVGFVISGCLVKKYRFGHGLKVAGAVWLVSLINLVVGVSLMQWAFSIIYILVSMVVGMGISLLIVRPPHDAPEAVSAQDTAGTD